MQRVSISQKTREYERNARVRGWDWMYLNGSGQPKVDDYWHKDRYNVEGQLLYPAGSITRDQPNEVDSNMRRADRGMLPYPPSDTCMCEWCTAKRGTKAKVTYHQLLNQIPVPEEPRDPVLIAEEMSQVIDDPGPVKCPECDWVASGTPKQQDFRLRGHIKKHVKAMRL